MTLFVDIVNRKNLDLSNLNLPKDLKFLNINNCEIVDLSNLPKDLEGLYIHDCKNVDGSDLLESLKQIRINNSKLNIIYNNKYLNKYS